MNGDLGAWAHVEQLTWEHVSLVVAVMFVAKLFSLAVRWLLRRAAENAGPHLRLSILRTVPIARLLIGITALIVALPILVEPTFGNLVAIVASVGLALAFALKDYGSSIVAGLATVVENIYQPGDWVEIGGIYGEVRSIGLRAVRIVTADDNEVIIPHSQLWSGSVSNATSGNRRVLCVAPFYLHPDHDAVAVQRQLTEVAQTSSYREPESKVTVIVTEKPWGTQYRLKAYAKESRDQFLFITDLTVRGKEALRAMGVRFGQAPYAETRGG